jgi:hypothetical protein
MQCELLANWHGVPTNVTSPYNLAIGFYGNPAWKSCKTLWVPIMPGTQIQYYGFLTFRLVGPIVFKTQLGFFLVHSALDGHEIVTKLGHYNARPPSVRRHIHRPPARCFFLGQQHFLRSNFFLRFCVTFDVLHSRTSNRWRLTGKECRYVVTTIPVFGMGGQL